MRADLFLLGTALLAAACTPQTDLTNVPADGTPAPTPTGPAGATLVDPAAGATAVPLNLAGVVVRFPGAVTWGTGSLVVCDGATPVPASPPTATACAAGDAGACYRVDLAGSLPPSTSCTVGIGPGASDATGAPISAGTIGVFQDADAPDTTPPVLSGVVVSAAGPCVDVSFTTDEPASGTIVVQAGGVEVDTPAGAGLTSFDVGIPLGALPPSTAATVTVNATDQAGNSAVSAPFAFTTPVALPPIAITEVLANPKGPEPQQEYVELRNLGDADLPLAGLRLVDSKGGDDLPAETLAAGGYALVVTATYDPDEGSDPAPRAGTLLVRVDTRLGSDGLSNSGEVVQLVQGDAVVSSYGGWVSVSAGSWNGNAVHRLVQTACDSPDAWNHTPLPPTPGWGPP
ncbi:MAG TPA: lamin tail domain-containing protein [Polyangia bacterium]|nr:lamin tail domain-containing protein [Polyangia bacterium]